jgi:hypothetical protein
MTATEAGEKKYSSSERLLIRTTLLMRNHLQRDPDHLASPPETPARFRKHCAHSEISQDAEGQRHTDGVEHRGDSRNDPCSSPHGFRVQETP